MNNMNNGVVGVALALSTGIACAQPVVDGSLDAGLYRGILWVQNQPTGFGDNQPQSGNPGAVTTGIEFAIPLSAIGNPAGSFRITGWVNSGDRTFMSNQVIGGLPGSGNLGGTSAVNFTGISGTQWITLTPLAGAPTVDGQLDGAYGAAQFLQNNYTGFGNAQHGNVAIGSGSEIDAVYAAVSGGTLYLFIAGNLEANGNGLDLFFDTVGGGQATLSPNNPGVPPNVGGPTSNGLTNMTGLAFDTGFDADYYLTIDGDGTTTDVYFANLGAASGEFLGNGGYGVVGGALSGGTASFTGSATINNSNTAGVTGSPGTIPSPDFANGSELDGLYAARSGNRLYLFLSGNLESTFNKIDLFIDCAPGGQNALREDNVDIDFNGLNRMGAGPVGNPPTQAPGLTFDAAFAPDYYLNFTNGANPVEVYMNAAVLRTDGPLRDPLTFVPLDYGAYDGGPKSNPAIYPVPFAGPRIDPQTGLATSIYCNYGPRTSTVAVIANPSAPVGTPNLLRGAINNNNIAGVTGVDTGNCSSPFSVAGAAAVGTGVEISLDLTELGWDGSSQIRLAGFINNGSHDFVSNQVIGGLPNSASCNFAQNLGEPRVIDFNQLTGNQYVVLCYADCNQSGSLTIADFGCFQGRFASGNPYADCNGSGTLTIADFGCFQGAFASSCP